MKHALLAAVALRAFANTNAASKLYVCATPQNVDLAQADFEALVWVQINSVGSRGEMGKNTNLLNYDTWDTTVTQKAKGITDAGSVELEVARLPNDAGQNILRAAAAVGNNNNYAFKELRSDGGSACNGSVFYNRGLVTGPRRPGGRNEDFDVEVFTLGFQQAEVVVNPGAGGIPPTLTVAPAITGTAKVANVLTVSNGTFTGDPTITYEYQWFVGGVQVAGATSNTYTPVTADIGKVATARVIGRNASGFAVGFAAPTSAIVA